MIMAAFIPDWLEAFRLLGTFLIWAIFPLQLFSIWKGQHQLQRWQAAEDARVTRWSSDMAAAMKLLEECSHLRAQAEVSLAMARQQAIKAAPTSPA